MRAEGMDVARRAGVSKTVMARMVAGRGWSGIPEREMSAFQRHESINWGTARSMSDEGRATHRRMYPMKKILSLLGTAALVLALPLSAWAFGAIAVADTRDGASPGHGIAKGADSEAQAKADALKACAANGHQHCKVAVWYTQCGAYAASKSSQGMGYGPTRQVAESNAMGGCAQGDCKVVVSGCE